MSAGARRRSGVHQHRSRAGSREESGDVYRRRVADPDQPRPPWSDFLRLDDAALLAQCEFDRFRASGPGGQKRNVTDSAVRLRHRPSGLAAQANESRSQNENRARALRRLRLTIALELRATATLEGYEPPEQLTLALRPGRAALGRRDARFLTAVAQALDLLEALGWQLSRAARHAGASTAAFGRFLARDEAVLRAVNARRRALELRPLRP